MKNNRELRDAGKERAQIWKKPPNSSIQGGLAVSISQAAGYYQEQIQKDGTGSILGHRQSDGEQELPCTKAFFRA